MKYNWENFRGEEKCVCQNFTLSGLLYFWYSKIFFSFFVFFLFQQISLAICPGDISWQKKFLVFPLSETIQIHPSLLKDVVAWLGFGAEGAFLSVRGEVCHLPRPPHSHPEVRCHLDHVFLIGNISSLSKLPTNFSSQKFENDVFWLTLGDSILVDVLFWGSMTQPCNFRFMPLLHLGSI